MRVSIALFAFTYIIVTVSGCDPKESHNGCMIEDNTCKCGYGCKTEYIYKSRRACRKALKDKAHERSSGADSSLDFGFMSKYGASYSAGYGTGFIGNIDLTKPISVTPTSTKITNSCRYAPCSRGICIQTANEAGFTCKCAGTGFYGQLCEEACPTMPMRGMPFPHECVII